MRIQDAAQRSEALDYRRSFICEAPAGSGKTELLTQRILRLLAQVDRPESVLAITFTRKAAGEMSERVIESLLLGEGDRPDDGHKILTWELAQAVLKKDSKFGWDLLKNTQRLNISTFDSLCTWVNQTLPIASKLGVDASICEDARVLYEEASEDFIRSLNQSPRWGFALSRLLEHLDVRVELLKELFVNMLATRDTWVPFIFQAGSDCNFRSALERNLQSVVLQILNRVSCLLESEKHELKALLAFAANNIVRDELDHEFRVFIDFDFNENWPDTTLAGLKKWKALKSFFIKNDGQWRKAVDKRIGFPIVGNKEEKEACKALKLKATQCIERVRNLKDSENVLSDLNTIPNATFSDQQWNILDSLFEVLPILVAHLQLVFERHNEVDFIEVAARARLALGTPEEPTDLTLKLDHSIQHILVDEFQDTSFAQIELLERLTAGWEQGDGRTIFCVGDAMQSIYGFRGARVGLFLHAKKTGLGSISLDGLRLCSNFRSEKPIIDWVNKTFSTAFPEADDVSLGAVKYSASVAYKPEKNSYVRPWAFSTENSKVEEARAIREEIQGLICNDSDATIAILVKSRTHASEIVRELKENQIGFNALDLELLSTREEIRDLLSLAIALTSPDRRIEWLAILRAPWCGLILKDLEIVANQEIETHLKLPIVYDQIEATLLNYTKSSQERSSGQESFNFSNEVSNAGLSQDGFNRLSRFYRIVSMAIEDRQRKPFHQWLEGVWIELGGPDCLESEIAQSNVERFFDCVRDLVKVKTWPSADEINRKVNDLYAAPDPHASGQVQIMTIHKSKGLEFDYVFLPSLQSAPRKDDESLILIEERVDNSGEEQILFAPISEYGQEKDSIYKFIHSEQKKRKQYEECRLLYVACTRAKKGLYLTAQLKYSDQDDEQFKRPSKGSLLSFIWDSISLSVVDKTPEVASHKSLQNELIDYDLRDEAPEELTSEIPLACLDGLTESQWQEKYPYSKPLKRLRSDWPGQKIESCHLLDEYIPFSDYANSVEDIEWYDCESVAARAQGTVTHKILQVALESNGKISIDNIDVKEQSYFKSLLAQEGVLEHQLEETWKKIDGQLAVLAKSDVFRWLYKNCQSCKCEYAISSFSGDEECTYVLDVLLEEDDGSAWVIDYKTSTPSESESLDAFYLRELETYRGKMESYARVVSSLGYHNVKYGLLFAATGELKTY